MKSVQFNDELNIIHQTDDLTIIHRAAAQMDAQLILSFSGVCHKFDGMGAMEFAKSLANFGMDGEILFISELARTWYSNVADRIVDFVQSRYPGRRIITLGNSMGGSGALLLSRLLPGCEVAVSFVPQYSVSPCLMPDETRWREHSQTVQNWAYEMSVPDQGHRRARQLLFFGADESRDMPHAERLSGALNPDSTIFIVDGCGHNVASFLKNKGLLPGLLGCCFNMDKDADCVGRYLAEAGVGYRLFPSG